MSKKNTQFRDLLSEIYRLDELFIISETKQLLYLADNENFRHRFYNEYQKAFRGLLTAAIQQAQFNWQVKEIIDFIRSAGRFMFDKGSLPVLFEEMRKLIVDKEKQIAADAEVKPKTRLESAVFRALSPGFVQTSAAAAVPLVKRFKLDNTQTARPTIKIKSSVPAEENAPCAKRMPPTGAGHDAKSNKTMPRREAVAESGSDRHKTILQSAGFRALRLSFVETFVAGFLRLIKWLKPNKAQTIRPRVEAKSLASMLPPRAAEPEKKSVKSTLKSKTVAFDDTNSGNKCAREEGNQSNDPILSQIREVFPEIDSRLAAYKRLWQARSSMEDVLGKASASLEIRR